MKNKRGISLIVLVITIIVMIILAASVVIALNNTGIINKANEAVDKTNLKEVEQLANLVWSEEFLDGKRDDTLKSAVLEKLKDYTDTFDIDVDNKGVTVTKKDNEPIYDHNAPELHPDDGSEPQQGDKFTYGNYEYCYQAIWNASSYDNGTWINVKFTDGWTVRCMYNMADPGPILESINGEPVTLMYATFINCTELTEIPVIPQSIVQIQAAFAKCTFEDASDIIIPSSVTSIYGAFQNNENLKIAPTLPNTINDMSNAFFGCTALTTVESLPPNVTSLSQTFRECSSLVDVSHLVIPSTVTNIGSAFYNCTSLTTLPQMENATGVTSLNYTFRGCISLTDLRAYKLPPNVTSMLDAFVLCSALTYSPELPLGVTSLEYTFAECTSLIATPDLSKLNSLTNMKSTFSGCTSLQSASVIPEKVTDLTSTFNGCTSLNETVSVPCSITSSYFLTWTGYEKRESHYHVSTCDGTCTWSD